MSTTKSKDRVIATVLRKRRGQGMQGIDVPLSLDEQAKIYKTTITLPILTPHQPAKGVNQ